MELSTTETIQLWFHYEQIAMHFNELIIQYRLQLMGGVGIIGSMSYYLISQKDIKVRYLYQSLISLLIITLVSGAMYLDVNYYSKLLAGAVEELLQIEHGAPYINLSTNIAKLTEDNAGTVLIWYYSFLIPLILFFIYSTYQFVINRRKQP